MNPSVDEPFVFHEEESFNGAVARWAESAWLERMMDVTRAAGVTFGHRQNAAAADDVAICALADEMEVDAGELLRRATPAIIDARGNHNRTRVLGLSFPVALVEKRRRLYSPAALAETPFHRAIWDVRLLPVDLDHGEVLLHSCQNPECEGRALGWQHTMGIARCEHCMADLIASVTLRVSEDLLADLQPIGDLLRPSTRRAALDLLPPALRRDDGQVALDLLLALMPVVSPSLRTFLRAPLSADPLVVCRALADAWSMMTAWPGAFLDHAMKRINGRKGSHGDGNDGATVRFLRARRNLAFTESVTAVADELRGDLDLSGPNGPAIVTAACPIKEAAAIIGRGSGIVAQHRRQGVFRSILVLDGGYDLQPMLSRIEMQTVAAQIRSRIGLDSVHSRLGISLHGAEQLVELRLLDLLPHPYFLARYGVHQVTRASYDRLLDELDVASRPPCADAHVRLAAAMCAIGGRLKPWGPVLDALRRRSVPFRIAAGSGRLAQRILVRMEDVPFFSSLTYERRGKAIIAPAASMSKQDAMETLNITPKEGTKLFADVATAKGAHDRPIAVSDVLRTAASHISAAELGMRRGGIGTSRALNDALAAGLRRAGPAGFFRPEAEAEYFSGARPNIAKISD